MAAALATIGRINDALLAPFRAPIDLETAILVLVLLLTVAGGWHLVLEKVEL